MINLDTMFSGNMETPWHKQGKLVEGNLTSAEAIQAAGLDWKVVKKPVLYNFKGQKMDGQPSPKKELLTMANQFVTVREDTGAGLGIVGGGYKLFQNSECFNFMDAVMQTKEAVYETAGSLGGGRRVWMLAKIDGEIRVNSTDDIIYKYLLIYTSHDGSLKIDVCLTTIRVVCQNTANLAVQEAKRAGNLFAMRHTKNVGMKVAEAREKLRLVNTWYADFNDQINAMADVKMNASKMKAYIASLGFDTEVKIDEETDKEVETRSYKQGQEITELFASGKGNKMTGVKGSLWAAFNGVTEYVDWNRTTRKTDDYPTDDEARLNSQWFGSGRTLKEKAFNEALKLVA